MHNPQNCQLHNIFFSTQGDGQGRTGCNKHTNNEGCVAHRQQRGVRLVTRLRLD